MTDLIEREMIALLPRLRRFSYGLTGNADDADDLLQESCAKAIGSISSWQKGTRLDSWMYRIIQNTWTDNRRRHAIRQNNADELRQSLDQHVDEEKRLEDRRRLEQVRLAIELLPDDQRAIMVMTCLEGIAYKEVAAILDIPMGTVMSRLARGRKKLHELLKEAPSVEKSDGPKQVRGGT